MHSRKPYQSSLFIIVLFYIWIALACSPADNSATELKNGFLVLEGPWPASVEGRFEIAEISDAGGEDYMAFGWIETSQGNLPVQVFGRVLKDGSAENGGNIHAQVRPARGVPDSYDIIMIKPTP